MEDEIIYRWYWFVGGKWLSTCWVGASETEATEVARKGFYHADRGNKTDKLVIETKTFRDA